MAKKSLVGFPMELDAKGARLLCEAYRENSLGRVLGDIEGRCRKGGSQCKVSYSLPESVIEELEGRGFVVSRCSPGQVINDGVWYVVVW